MALEGNHPDLQENCVMYVDDRRKFWLGSLLLLLLAVALATGWLWFHKARPGIYGAIALSQRSLGFGASWGYTDPAQAYDRAQKECAKAGAADCQVRVSLAGTCGALVMSSERNQTFAVSENDRDSAGALALAQCQATGATDCLMHANICGDGKQP